MSHPNPHHDPENVKEYDWTGVMEHEAWFKEYEEYQEWMKQNQLNDEERE